MTGIDSPFSMFWMMMANRVPFFLVALIGLTVALSKWRTAPWPARWVAAGCILLLTADIGSVAFAIGISRIRALDMATIQVLSWVETLVHVTGMGMLLTAAFVGRSRPRATEED